MPWADGVGNVVPAHCARLAPICRLFGRGAFDPGGLPPPGPGGCSAPRTARHYLWLLGSAARVSAVRGSGWPGEAGTNWGRPTRLERYACGSRICLAGSLANGERWHANCSGGSGDAVDRALGVDDGCGVFRRARDGCAGRLWHPLVRGGGRLHRDARLGHAPGMGPALTGSRVGCTRGPSASSERRQA